MDKDKLDKAAKQHAEKKCEQGAVSSIRCAANFKDGANWLLSQPLDDRLTAEEAEKIRKIYNGDGFGELDFIELVSTRRIFHRIFGTEFFTGNTPSK